MSRTLVPDIDVEKLVENGIEGAVFALLKLLKLSGQRAPLRVPLGKVAAVLLHPGDGAGGRLSPPHVQGLDELLHAYLVQRDVELIARGVEGGNEAPNVLVVKGGRSAGELLHALLLLGGEQPVLVLRARATQLRASPVGAERPGELSLELDDVGDEVCR